MHDPAEPTPDSGAARVPPAGDAAHPPLAWEDSRPIVLPEPVREVLVRGLMDYFGRVVASDRLPNNDHEDDAA
jgi:hypothetical protein